MNRPLRSRIRSVVAAASGAIVTAPAGPALAAARADPNPLVPSAWEGMWSLLVLFWLVLTIVALVALVRARVLSRAESLLWALLIVVVPVLGAVGWLVANRRFRHAMTASH